MLLTFYRPLSAVVAFLGKMLNLDKNSNKKFITLSIFYKTEDINEIKKC